MKFKLLILSITSLTSLILAADEKREHRHDPDKLAEVIIKKYDHNGDGTLNLVEFKKSHFCKHVTKRHGADEANKLFSHSDNNKDGELTPSEIARIDQVKASTQYRKHKKPNRKF